MNQATWNTTVMKSLVPFVLCLAVGPAACTDEPGSDPSDTDASSGTDTSGPTTGTPTPPDSDPDTTAGDPTGETTAADCVPDLEPMIVDRPTEASVEIYDRCGVTVHSYVAPATAVGSGLHIFETENTLVLVDAHFMTPISQDFRAYADELGKPIDRIIITHEHRDHWVGLGAAFSDVDAYSSAGVIALLEGGGLPLWESFQPPLPTAWAPGFMVPTLEQPSGSEVIDGVTFEFEAFADHEAEESIVIHLPDHGVLAVGDLVYNGFHGIFAGPQVFDGWVETLETLQARPGVELVLVGHGRPGDASVLSDMATYIDTARTIFGSGAGPEQFRAQLEAEYPDRLGGDQFFGITLGRLFPPPRARADEQTANSRPTVGAQPEYPEPAPDDAFAAKNCMYFDLGADDDYLGLDAAEYQHELCLLNTYTSLRHRIITKAVDAADQDLYDRHRAYIDRFTASADGAPLSTIYDVTCNGGDCQALMASDPETRTPIFENIAELFGGSSRVGLELGGGGFVDVEFFAPRAGPSSLIPSQFTAAELPRFGDPGQRVSYDFSEAPIRIPEIEYPRGQPVVNDNAIGLSCEIAEGAQHEGQRYLVRYRKNQGTRVADNEYVRVLGLLNAEYNASGDSEQGYFSVHVLWSPISEVDPGAEPTTYLHERLVIPKQQACVVQTIDAIETVPAAEAEAALADGDSLTAWLESREAEVAPR